MNKILRRSFLFFVMTNFCLASPINLIDSSPSDNKREAAPQYEDPDKDPFEPLNRKIFHFNRIVDGVLLNPITYMYKMGAPDAVQTGLSNVLTNVSEPVTFINDCLQAKGNSALESFARFFINTIFGLGGIFDVADKLGLPAHKETFNTTLQYWGVPQGPYLVIPVLGPSCPRFLLGMGGDYVMDPYNYYMAHSDRHNWIYLRSGLKILVARADIIDDIKNFEENSVDFYAAMRSFYKQYMNAARNNGNIQYNSPSLEEFTFDDEENEEIKSKIPPSTN